MSDNDRPSGEDEAGGAAAAGEASSGDGAQGFYLRLVTERLTGWQDPAAMLELALARDHFLLLAQKILPLKSALPEPQCHEVLLRLKQEEEQLLPPGGFLDLAESIGMMEKIDRWVVHALLAWGAARLRKAPAERLPMMCLNVSAAALCSPDFSAFVRGELDRTGYPPRALCFEIEEGDIIEHRDSVARFISALNCGCRFMVDSFGGVRVSFSHLAGLAIDFLKIDGAIVQNVHREPSDLIKAWAINLACQKVGMRTVAKLVETRETLDMLREIEIDYVQGFGIARPVSLAEIA